MEIVESVTIFSEMERVWDIFTDLACWNEWCRSVRRDAKAEGYFMSEGQRLSLSIRPWVLPLSIRPVVECVVQHDRVVWFARKFGLFSKHEFLFTNLGGAVLVTSREIFIGPKPFMMFLPEKKIRNITAYMLGELKERVESQLPTL